MDLDLECQHQVVKKYSSEEGKKEEKSYLPKKIHSLKKRVEFLNLRNECKTFHGKLVILNITLYNEKIKYGITVTKKIGNAVKRNYLKRVFRNIINKNSKKISKPVAFEVIPKKNILKHSFSDIEKDVIKLLEDFFK